MLLPPLPPATSSAAPEELRSGWQCVHEWGNQQRMQDVAERKAGGWAVSSCFVAQAATFVVIVIKIMLECFVSFAAIAALPRAAPVCL